mmetsp:Transcript_32058/g.57484  ORF Transcript_32058/g.57484 Transcript_32058/m.57484 type:complete len:311 (-) Transcript_32058:2637-3569(-)
MGQRGAASAARRSGRGTPGQLWLSSLDSAAWCGHAASRTDRTRGLALTIVSLWMGVSSSGNVLVVLRALGVGVMPIHRGGDQGGPWGQQGGSGGGAPETTVHCCAGERRACGQGNTVTVRSSLNSGVGPALTRLSCCSGQTDLWHGHFGVAVEVRDLHVLEVDLVPDLVHVERARGALWRHSASPGVGPGSDHGPRAARGCTVGAAGGRRVGRACTAAQHRCPRTRTQGIDGAGPAVGVGGALEHRLGALWGAEPAPRGQSVGGRRGAGRLLRRLQRRRRRVGGQLATIERLGPTGQWVGPTGRLCIVLC